MAIQFPPPSVEQFFRTFRIGTFTVDKEETRVIFSSNMDGKVNLWAMDFERLYPYPLTTLGENCGGVMTDPEGRYVLAAFDKDGDENWQVFALPPAGGEPQPILQGEGEKFFPADLSKDGRFLYYTTSRGNSMFLNSYRRDLETDEDELLHEGEGASTFLAAVAPEGDAFVTVEALSNTVTRMFLHRDGERIQLKRSEEPHGARAADMTDRDTVYFLTDEGDDIHYLARWDAGGGGDGESGDGAGAGTDASGTFTQLARIEGQDMVSVQWHKEGNALYIITLHGVVDRLHRYDIGSGQLTEIDLPYDTVDQFKVGKSGTLYVLGRSANVPFNISRKVPGGEWQQLTDNRVFGVAPESLRDAEVVRYKSFDDLEIEALLFRPLAEKDNGYTVFWPHGGPQAAERKFYRSMFQMLLAAGYTVFAPNFRGSTGYGTRFMKMVERDWGHGPRLDNVAGVEWLIEQGIADKDKIFLIGGSYGGYMTLLLHGRHPEYWRACVDIFGVSNVFTFINSVPDHWKPMMEAWIGHPEKDKERLTRDNPITYLKNMTKPMLVIQGANDPRVVKAESDQIVEALQKQGTEVEYMVLDDEGHGFSRLENEIAVYRRMLEFLERHR